MNSRIAPILAFVAALAIFFIYVNPTWGGSVTKLKAAIAADERALTAAKTYTSQQNELTSKENSIDPADIARLAVFLPDSVDNVRLILDLNTLAARSGVSLSNIDVSNASGGTTAVVGAVPSVGQKPYSSVDISLSVVGTYTGFQTFLTGVEKSARLLDVRDLVIRGSDTGVYTYQMSIRFYWLR